MEIAAIVIQVICVLRALYLIVFDIESPKLKYYFIVLFLFIVLRTTIEINGEIVYKGFLVGL